MAAAIIGLTTLLYFNVDYVRQNIELSWSNLTGRHWTLRGHFTKKSFYSDTLKKTMQLYVYTPPGYDNRSKDDVYPSLYLLHGYPDVGYTGWIRFGRAPELIDKLIVQKKIPPMVVVFPIAEGVGAYGDSEYIDAVNPAKTNAPGANMLSCLSEDLPHWVDSHYQTDGEPSHRWIGGVSTGGYGAMNIALQHPLQFGVGISLSGYYNAEESGYARQCWGYRPTKEQLFEQSPARYVARNPDPVWKKSFFYVSYGAQERPAYREEAESFVAQLRSQGIPCSVRMESGKHSWDQWRSELVESLTILAKETLPKRPSSKLNPDQVKY